MSAPTPAAGSAVTPIRVLIADDHAVVRDGLRALVDAQPGLEVVGLAADGQQAWQLACSLRPDVVVLDVSMPTVGGLEATERITADCPGVRVVVLTMHEERGYVARLLAAGARGYVLKRAPSSELVQAIRAVAAGRRYVDPSLAGDLLSDPAGRRADQPPSAAMAGLTPRELDVLRLLALGHTNKEIAATLLISTKTVETHRAGGMRKLGLGSRAALVRFAATEGWLEGL